jgi:acyl-CoA synthetase (AMP-forming)/AMP-acid ligase II
MQHAPAKPLRDCVARISTSAYLWAPDARISISDIVQRCLLGEALHAFEGRSVLLATSDQLTTALALVALDGIARRLTLCTPDIPTEQVSYLISAAEADAVVHGPAPAPCGIRKIGLQVACSASAWQQRSILPSRHRTEWIMLTSGTSGLPKLVVHTLASLTAALRAAPTRGEGTVWGTFYDIRRYGGMQILLRALLGGTSLVLSSAHEPVCAHLRRLTESGVTHLTGTPSHWRRAIIDPAAATLPLRYVRLSGEIADQAILDRLRLLYPQAKLVHAFASTEAGVGFEVSDGCEGFPLQLIESNPTGAELKIADTSLRIRSRGTALRYLGPGVEPLRDTEGFVDTGDIVEQRGNRYYFTGRRGGIINVGGLKVFPEEVEAVINLHPDVHTSRVRGRRNPVTGAVLVADVVLKNELNRAAPGTGTLRDEILQTCRERLARHKVPATIRFVTGLELSSAGKTARDA